MDGPRIQIDCSTFVWRKYLEQAYDNGLADDSDEEATLVASTSSGNSDDELSNLDGAGEWLL